MLEFKTGRKISSKLNDIRRYTLGREEQPKALNRWIINEWIDTLRINTCRNTIIITVLYLLSAKHFACIISSSQCTL